MGQLIVAGGDAERGLEALLPADLTILKDGRLRYSLLLAPGRRDHRRSDGHAPR
jgi:aminomethyltransferase